MSIIGTVNKFRTICPFYASPSSDGIVATVEENRITGIEGDKEHQWSRGYACPKSRNEWELLYHPGRFKQPLLTTGSFTLPRIASKTSRSWLP